MVKKDKCNHRWVVLSYSTVLGAGVLLCTKCMITKRFKPKGNIIIRNRGWFKSYE